VVIGKTHGFTRLQRLERAKNRGMAKALGDTAGIEGIDLFG
jgi:hypothetical protein